MNNAVQIIGGKELLASLVAASVQSPEKVHEIVQRGCFNIKGDWRRRWSGHPHIPALPYAITYDTELFANAASGEVGPDKGRRQGALGNIIEFGTPNNAPIPGGLPTLEEEAPKFEKALGDLGVKLLSE